MKHILVVIALSYLSASMGVTLLFLALMFFKEWRRFGTLQAEQLKVFGLTEECPFDHGNAIGCHFHAIREKSLRQRCELVSELSRSDLRSLLSLHEKCLARKQRKSVDSKVVTAIVQI